MNKEQQKDEIISIVKKAIAANSYIALSDDRVISDCNGVDHIAEEVADTVYNFYKPIDNEPVGALGECGMKGECEKKAVKEFAEKLQKELPCRDYTFNGIIFSMILTSSVKYVIDKLLKEYEK